MSRVAAASGASGERDGASAVPVPLDLVEAVAARVVELLAERDALPQIMKADDLAEYLGVSRDVIYANADRLGAIRLGEGPRARIRFAVDGATIREWASRPARRRADAFAPAQPSGSCGTSAPRADTSVPLLPVRGDER